MSAHSGKSRLAAIVISSHVARGSVGNRAAVFALETLGIAVWAVPTVILPWHPGHGPATRLVAKPDVFAALVADLATSQWLGEVDAVLSGYLGHASQAEAIAELVGAVKERNPRATYLCDPVIGDGGGLYAPGATAEAIRDLLLPLADVATPNRFELEWLTGRSLPDLHALAQAALDATPSTMLVTSAPATSPERIANLLVTANERLLVEHTRFSNPPNGAGDLTAALFLAGLVSGKVPSAALEAATRSVCDVLAAATERGADELWLATDAERLRRPAAAITITDLTRDVE